LLRDEQLCDARREYRKTGKGGVAMEKALCEGGTEPYPSVAPGSFLHRVKVEKEYPNAEQTYAWRDCNESCGCIFLDEECDLERKLISHHHRILWMDYADRAYNPESDIGDPHLRIQAMQQANYWRLWAVREFKPKEGWIPWVAPELK
jgi:hypothetical protein